MLVYVAWRSSIILSGSDRLKFSQGIIQAFAVAVTPFDPVSVDA